MGKNALFVLFPPVSIGTPYQRGDDLPETAPLPRALQALFFPLCKLLQAVFRVCGWELPVSTPCRVAAQYLRRRRSLDLLAWRDLWMFMEGVALVMRQVEPDEAKNFAAMCAEFKDKQRQLLVELEDQVWGKMAEKAAEEGFLSTEDSRRWFKAVCYERGFVLS